MKTRLKLLPSLPLRLGQVRTVRTTAAKARDSTAVLPDAYQVILENDDVRVVEFRAPRGHRTPMHSHPAHVIVNLSLSQVKTTGSDGMTRILSFQPGEVLWSEAVEHAGEVVSGRVHMILIEPKRHGRP